MHYDKTQLIADAYPVYKNPKTGYFNKKPVYWQSLVKRSTDGIAVWSDGGWHSKTSALIMANKWIRSRG